MSSYRMKYKIGLVEHSVVVPEDISAIPLGTILPYSANTLNPPAGFLFCDGSAVSRSMYADLFALIGTTFGSGDGSTTFNLPDLTLGEFLEGSSSAGVSKSAGLPRIFGYAYLVGSSTGTTATGKWVGSGALYSPTKYSSFSTSDNYISTKTTGTAIGAERGLFIDASRSSAVYGNSTTVQPKSVTVRYIIKAFTSISHDSELIDITQYASELNQRYDIRTDMTIIYPNNGTAENPASVAASGIYIDSNPFPGYRVACDAEVFDGSNWGKTGWYSYYQNSDYWGYGVKSGQLNDDTIKTVTGNKGLWGSSACSGAIVLSSNTTTAPCRVKVWKIGKLPS